MYTPKHNAENDRGVIRELVRNNDFGMLVVPRAHGEIEITHVPFILDSAGDEDWLRVHVARANPIAQYVLASAVTVVFQGPHAYVSPLWYEKSKEDVPTWNYAVAHAHITSPKEMSEAELVAQLDDLAKTHERGPTPWRLDEHPAESREKMLKAIIGFHLPVARWEAKLKLSQNRTPADHARVIAGLEARATGDDLALAKLMRERSKPARG